MLTYEQLRPALFKWAYYFQNNEFDFWDLINSVWLIGRIQKVRDVRLASIAVKRGMIDYLRLATGCRNRKRHFEKTGKRYHAIYNFTSLDVESEGGHDEGIGKNIELVDTSYIKPDSKDFFVALLKGFNRHEKLIIKLRYCEGFTFKEIGDVVGMTDAGVFLIHQSLTKRLRTRLRDLGETPRLSKAESDAGEVDRKRKQSFYNRDYYARNRPRILENRRQRREREATHIDKGTSRRLAFEQMI